MSRIGKKPVTIPEGVTAELLDAHTLQVKGAKGMLTEHFHPNMQISIENRGNPCCAAALTRSRTALFMALRVR